MTWQGSQTAWCNQELWKETQKPRGKINKMDAKVNDVDGKVSNRGRKNQQANWHFGKRKKIGVGKKNLGKLDLKHCK